MSESDLAAPAVEYLRDLGYGVFHEIVFYGPRADLVGIRKTREGATLIHVVELKTSLGFSVFDQALAWNGLAHYVTVGAPRIKTGYRGEGQTCRDLCERHGIGVVRLNSLTKQEIASGHYAPYEQTVAPRLRRSVEPHWVQRWLDRCDPETADGSQIATAGSKGGGYWTPFRATLNEVKNYLEDRDHPERREGVLFKTLINGIRHHYANSQSARGALAHWIDRGKLPGVETFIRDRKLHVRLTPEEV